MNWSTAPDERQVNRLLSPGEWDALDTEAGVVATHRDNPRIVRLNSLVAGGLGEEETPHQNGNRVDDSEHHEDQH